MDKGSTQTGVRALVTIGIRLAGLYEFLQNWMQAKNSPAIPRPKDGLPTGTRPIDTVGWDKDRLHGIKEGIAAKAPDWVGVDPDGNIWTGSQSREAVNHGKW